MEPYEKDILFAARNANFTVETAGIPQGLFNICSSCRSVFF